MKTCYFNIQSKGGAGKSMLTYLQALKYESDEMSLFVDLDSSTKTSVRQFARATDGRIRDVRIFGNIQVDHSSGQHITDNVKEGRGLADYQSFASRTIIRRELSKV